MGPPPALERPVRLSASEARALATALQIGGLRHARRTHRASHGGGRPGVLHDELAHRLRAAGPVPAEAVYETMASASSGHDVVAIDVPARGEGTLGQARDRAGASSTNGAYGTYRRIAAVRGLCGRSGWTESREAEVTGERFRAAGGLADGRPSSGEGLPPARLVFEDASRVLGARVARVSSGERPDADEPSLWTSPMPAPWLARQVCARLGTVRVESPEEVRAAVAAMATRIAGEVDAKEPSRRRARTARRSCGPSTRWAGPRCLYGQRVENVRPYAS